ncbi:MAG: hemolysin family protein [Lachnospiraceae bacterium]|jgi:putative hemolysin
MESNSGIWAPWGRKKDQEKTEADEYTEQLTELVEDGLSKEFLSHSEAEMIENVLEMRDKQAHDIMTDRSRIFALSRDLTLRDAMADILRDGKTRYPVYAEDLDDIVGMLHLRSALEAYMHPECLDMPLKDIDGLVSEAHFIPESKQIMNLFREMQSHKVHIAVVVDEYGQTSGIITLEDILEEIVGSIMDESDKDESGIQKRRDGTFVIEGIAQMEDVCRALNLDLGQEDFDTLNGFLISRLDRIPAQRERPVVKYGGWIFRVLRVDDNMIQLVAASKDPDWTGLGTGEEEDQQ